VPNNEIALEIVRELGNPILTTSIHDPDQVVEYTTDPELIHENYESLVDIVVDGGPGDIEPSTVLDCSGSEIVVVREGKGKIDWM
jgi:tRNA A37 threonylcarbamoyladenosine synthetase subunit TsaC/SUA5/YrdC